MLCEIRHGPGYVGLNGGEELHGLGLGYSIFTLRHSRRVVKSYICTGESLCERTVLHSYINDDVISAYKGGTTALRSQAVIKIHESNLSNHFQLQHWR